MFISAAPSETHSGQQFSADSRFMTYSAHISPSLSGITNQVYLWDFQIQNKPVGKPKLCGGGRGDR